MIPELGHYALLLALAVALIQTVFPLWGSVSGNTTWMSLAKYSARTQFLLVALAYAGLTLAFIAQDYSVAYVAASSHASVPLEYRISGVWGGHEGSLLLWALILALWSALVSVFSRALPERVLAQVLGVMGFISVGFLLFILLTSNPFERLLPAPEEGRNLNPLLQDFGLIIHPPLLYLGYVGFSVSFAFALAALMEGQMSAHWLRWVRPWTLIAWVFLTLGIAVGSWWAYYELGWGGWWFWDPVENASLMPWLIGTALIHSLAVTEKRTTFQAWTLLLAIAAFSLSLLGTFLVRSGVLTSVHAFASDPERGLFILIFLVLVVGLSLTLYALRAQQFTQAQTFHWLSRETGLLLNNLVLVVMTATVLLGTLYPLVLDALGAGKISVGPPYFNSVMLPLGGLLALLMALGVFVRWRSDEMQRLKRAWLTVLGLALILAAVLPYWVKGEFSILTMLGLFAAFSVLVGALNWLIRQARNLSIVGGALAHIGMGIAMIGITLTSLYSTGKDIRLAPQQRYELAGYEFEFKGVKEVRTPQYLAYEGHVTVYQDGQVITELYPQKRTYPVQTMPMTEAGIEAGLLRDLFVALGEPLEQNAWSLRIYHKPFIRWIWLGALLMALGGLVAMLDRRYRLAVKQDNPV